MKNVEMNNVIEIDTRELLKSLIKNMKFIVIITLIFTILGCGLSFFIISQQYEAKTKILIQKEEIKGEYFNNNDIQMYQKLLSTYTEIIKTNNLIQKVIDENNLDLTSEEVLDKIDVRQKNNSQILEISYKSKNRDEAEKLVKGITNEFLSRAGELIPNGKVTVVENVKLPEDSFSINKIIIIMSVLLGMLIGMGIIIFKTLIDDTLKSEKDIESKLNIPVIGVIPNESKKGVFYKND